MNQSAAILYGTYSVNCCYTRTVRVFLTYCLRPDVGYTDADKLTHFIKWYLVAFMSCLLIKSCLKELACSFGEEVDFGG